MSATRRQSLKLMGALGAVFVESAAAQHSHGPENSPPGAAFTPKTFSASEGAVVARIADLLIPATDTPGALAAGVPQYIDGVCAADPERRRCITEGIRWLDAHAIALHAQPFVALDAQQQIATLTQLSAQAEASESSAGPALFRTLKDLTVDGYYTSRAGLVEELNYQGNQMLAAFPGCHHEH